ncbi:hypothetical protein MUN84_18360 [Hymenobacter sp. 5516J-16]|uniref:hypothetical protein n=1 Tax=Hymenobacter sp. 5516J-16 TaxID=2932253 RepID=UPI001FD0AF14|nr:hypothetical protein [Hymenobacter sp. 5516J-16]UOQ76484.1 hypothetical protein MUN84_18360 [Hymenobacter sp. 5516J-16]
MSYAYNHYRFGSYESGGNNFSGNRLTGTAPHTLTTGLDFSQQLGFYLNPTVNHQSRLPSTMPTPNTPRLLDLR